MNNYKKIFKVLLQIPVPWVFILTYLVGVLFQIIIPIKINLEDTMILIKIIGAVLFGVGAFFAGWSLIIFRKAKTTTTPGESSNRLINWGPYKITRNPMYVSLTLAYIGEAGLLVQIWPLIVLPFVLVYVNWIVIPLEEEILIKDFKDEYKKYSSQVRRWL